MIAAKTQTAVREISRQFEFREVNKTYLAIVGGNLEPASGTVDMPLGGKVGPSTVLQHIFLIRSYMYLSPSWRGFEPACGTMDVSLGTGYLLYFDKYFI